MPRFLALGDSYTIGEGVATAESWPHLLVQALRKRDVAIETPTVIATTGWTTADLLEALAQQKSSLAPPYDLVTLMIGVNNQYQGLPTEQYQRELEALLAQATELAGGRTERVCLLSIPDWSLTPFAKDRDREAIAAEIKAMNKIPARLAYQTGAAFFNISEEARLVRYGDVYLSDDGLHYSAKMYVQWVEHFFFRVWHILYPGTSAQVPIVHQQQVGD